MSDPEAVCNPFKITMGEPPVGFLWCSTHDRPHSDCLLAAKDRDLAEAYRTIVADEKCCGCPRFRKESRPVLEKARAAVPLAAEGVSR